MNMFNINNEYLWKYHNKTQVQAAPTKAFEMLRN